MTHLIKPEGNVRPRDPEERQMTYCCPECGHADPRLQETCDQCGVDFYIWETTIHGMCKNCINESGMT